MGHAVTSQAECVEVASGVFGSSEGGRSAESFILGRTFTGHGLVMAGSRDEVAVSRIKIEVILAFESGKRVGQRSAHLDLSLGENLTEQGKPPLAFEALKEGGAKDFYFVVICEIL